MVNDLRATLARLIVRLLHRPRPLVIHAWLRLAAEADDIDEKRGCPNAVERRDPGNQPSSLTSPVLDQ